MSLESRPPSHDPTDSDMRRFSMDFLIVGCRKRTRYGSGGEEDPGARRWTKQLRARFLCIFCIQHLLKFYVLNGK